MSTTDEGAVGGAPPPVVPGEGAAVPRFSVVVPSFQQGRFLERTLRSILLQGEPVEVFVADGGSTDETLDVLRSFGDDIRWVSEPDDGQAAAVNAGIRATSGDLIGWLNSDDVYYEGALRRVREFFDAVPEVDFVYGQADHLDPKDQVLAPYPSEAFDPARLEETCFLCQPATFFRRRAIERVGGLDESLELAMDYDLWLRASDRGLRFAFLRERLAGSRLYPETKTLSRAVEAHVEVARILRALRGATPDRWLLNWAAAVRRHRFPALDENGPAHARRVGLLALVAAVRWNRSITPELRRLVTPWILGGPGRAEPKVSRAGRDATGSCPVGETSPPPAVRDSRGASIGFDVSQIGPPPDGCGHYARELLEALVRVSEGRRWCLLPAFGDHFWAPGGPPDVSALLGPTVESGWSHDDPQRVRSFWRDETELEARLGAPDLIHAHNYYCPVGLQRARLAYTVHDLLFYEQPEETSFANWLGCSRGVAGAARRADLIVANSSASRRQFLKRFPDYPPERTVVVPPISRFRRRRVPLRQFPRGLLEHESRLSPGGFWLAPGRNDPRKNVETVLDAYRRHASRREEAPPLVLVGGPSVPEADGVLRLGFVDDASLEWLVTHARAFVFVSTGEGFGMPALEAMSLGTPLVASTVGGLGELVAGAAWTVDPRDAEQIADALDRLDDSATRRRRLGAAGLERASRYDPEVSARRLLDAYDETLARPRLEDERRRTGRVPPEARFYLRAGKTTARPGDRDTGRPARATSR